MTFMQLVGVNQITVAVDNQIKKTVGLEVALVLDNTGSMLCGANGEPNYDTATCSGGVTTSPNKCLDATGWPNGNIVLNGSRICELTNAANNFVTTVFSGVTSNQQLYMAVVPYVTQVNVGAALCTGPTTCTSIAKDASGHFTDETGSVIYKQWSVTGNVTNASANIASVSPSANSGTTTMRAGCLITGTGIPANATVTTVTSGTAITISANATSTGSGRTLAIKCPIVYDATQGNPSPYVPSTSTTSTDWIGCVVEPTSTATAPALAAGTNPDTTDGPWPNWYAQYWQNGTENSWSVTSNNVNYPATLGVVASNWGVNGGPNNGCPVPMVALTTSASTLQATIKSMWPRDAGGTMVHVGMAWGWRTLSPNTPFPLNNTHPLDYTTANNQGWKKVVVLETDGQEEWPDANQYTGMGFVAEGKAGSTSTTTAATNLSTRLSTICTNMKAAGIIIYTIGLGNAGASNTALQNCAGPNPGVFIDATNVTQLNNAFQTIAQSLLALRLTQ